MEVENRYGFEREKGEIEMRIYISGPITNDPDYKRKFARVQAHLEQEGHKVINPSELNQVMPDAERSEYMSIRLDLLVLAEGVIMLNGWQKSCEACIENGYARASDKIVLEEKSYPGL